MGVCSKIGASSHGDQSNLSQVPMIKQIRRKLSQKKVAVRSRREYLSKYLLCGKKTIKVSRSKDSLDDRVVLESLKNYYFSL